VWAADEVYRAMSLRPPPEIYWHAANMGAKSRSYMALWLAFLAGRDRLLGSDGEVIRIPVIRPPVAGALVVPSYKLASGSVVQVLRELAGDWPTHEGIVSGAQDGIAILYVKHRLDTSDEYRKWSRLYLFPHEGEVPQALRLDFAGADEPPPEKIWRAIRNRAKAGREFYRGIGATPWERRFWEWLRGDFPHQARVVVDGRMRLQSSLWDNDALHVGGCRNRKEGGCQCPSIVRQEQVNRGSPWRLASLYGDHVDLAGSCPYDIDGLMEYRGKAWAGERYYAAELRDEEMALRAHPRGDIMLWGGPVQNDRVLVVANPSAGVKPAEGEKGSHLANVQAVSIVQRKVLARWVGYLTPPEFAMMCRAITNGYRDSIFVPEMNGGWGEELLRKFLELPAAEGTHCMIYQDVDPSSTSGNAAVKMGWWQTEVRREALISAGQRVILERSVGIPSLEEIENLMQVAKDKRGRYDDPENGPHPRDHIVLGMAASIMENGYLVPPKAREPVDARERFERAHKIRPEYQYDGYAPDEQQWR
jgi:hypothetical protein